MIGLLGSLFGGALTREDERSVFARRGIRIPDDLMTPAEKLHRFHKEQFDRMAREALAQGLTVKGYRGDANVCELIVE